MKAAPDETVTFPSARNMSNAEFRLHMEQCHPATGERSRASHGTQHSRGYRGTRPGHVHLTFVKVENPPVIVTVPAAREMVQWKFLKHVRLRHPDLRYATYEVHESDHYGNRFDHEHVPGIWATVTKAEALQEAINFLVPILPAAERMEPGAYTRHEREQHGVTFDTYLDHDLAHAETPDQQSHMHKENNGT